MSPDAPLVAAAPFYRRLMDVLAMQRIPFLVGGAFAFAHFTGIRRPTKDLDLFVRQGAWPRLAAAARREGWVVDLPHPHWLGKVHGEGGFVDVIFSSGNGLSPVDDAWFAHAAEASVLGRPVLLAPVEESIWTKAFIMERERFDGADVAHLIQAVGPRLNWQRLLARFGPHWRVLLAHLVLFGFIYPGERALVPRWVLAELLERARRENDVAVPASACCAGTLLSREQYLPT